MGSELTIEPFRWDQRFFSIVLNIGSVPIFEHNLNSFIPSAQNSPINVMCEVTGGRSYLISTNRMLMQCLESLVGKIQAGVVLNLEKYYPDPQPYKDESQNSWEKCRRMILVQKSATKGYFIGHWPIPEDVWININAATLPQRSAHPLVKFKCDPVEPLSMEEIPFDKYEMEPSPLTQFILERRQPNAAWQVFVPSSLKQNDLGYPFGYIKASSNLMAVNLFVMPYNYPILFQLMNELIQTLRLKPTKSWTDRFENYLKGTPAYYYAPLRRVLSKKGLQHLISENLECCLSVQVQTYLKKVKAQAKTAFEQVSAYQTPRNNFMPLLTLKKADSLNETKEFNNWLQSSMTQLNADFIRSQFNDFPGFQLYTREHKARSVPLRVPSEIPRNKLIESLQKLRVHFYKSNKRIDEDDIHSIPIQDMGNYHDYLKNHTQPLRELENQMVRQHMFGNPFKLVSKEQKAMFGADEIDEVYEESAENQQQKTPQQPIKRASSEIYRGSSNKRRGTKGPLSRSISYSKIYSSRSSTASYSESERMDDDGSSIISNSTVEDTPDISIISETVSEPILKPFKQESDIANMNDFIEQPANVEMPISAEIKLLKNSYLDEEYIKTRCLCIKLLRKPGKDTSKLIQLILKANFTTKLKKFLVQELIYESNRLKRKNLISQLQSLEL